MLYVKARLISSCAFISVINLCNRPPVDSGWLSLVDVSRVRGRFPRVNHFATTTFQAIESGYCGVAYRVSDYGWLARCSKEGYQGDCKKWRFDHRRYTLIWTHISFAIRCFLFLTCYWLLQHTLINYLPISRRARVEQGNQERRHGSIRAFLRQGIQKSHSSWQRRRFQDHEQIWKWIVAGNGKEVILYEVPRCLELRKWIWCISVSHLSHI